MYGVALRVAEGVNIQESTPRFTNSSRQSHRSNPPAENASEYYKRSLTIPMLDHLILELDDRFNAESTLIVREFMTILPAEISTATMTPNTQSISNLLDLYASDLPSLYNLDTEFDLWKNMWAQNQERALEINTPEKCLNEVDPDYFPNISTLINLMATLPVTSCECERSISLLKLIKTSLRSTMTQERLNGLAMMQYHCDIDIDPLDVVTEFSQRNPRRMQLQ